MKNTELFDILGKIDDKFYDEALGGDTERPIKIQIKDPAFSIKNVLMPVAACLAVAAGIGVTAHFLSRTDFIDPNRTTSNTVSDAVLENPNITDTDIAECEALLKDRFPDIDISEMPVRAIDIDFDGCDEVLVLANELFIFDKTPDGMFETAQLSEYDKFNLDNLYKYDLDGERYWYYSDDQMLKLSDKETIFAYTFARIKFENGEYSIDHSLGYGYKNEIDSKRDDGFKQWFFTTNFTPSEPMEMPESNITSEEFKEKWVKHTGLPAFNYYATFDEEYKPLSEVEIPVIESSHWYGDNDAPLHGVVIDTMELGEYKLCLLANTVFRLADNKDSDYFWANTLSMGLVKDNKLISMEAVRFNSAARSGAANFRLYPQKSKSYFKLYEFEDFAVAAVGFVNFDDIGWESNFFGIKDGTVTGLFGKTSPYSKGVDPCVNAPFELTVYGNSLIDNENAVKYEFYPNAFEDNPYEVPHFTTNVYLPEGEYPAYNGQAAPKATLCEKKLNLDNETVKLLALDAKPVTKNGIECVEFSQLFLRADFGSDNGWVKPVNVPGSLPVSKLDECLVPILFNAGKPDSKELIAVFWGTDKVSPAGEKYDSAVFHSAGNGEPFHMDQSQSGAIIPSGDPCELGAFTVSTEGCMISLDVGVQISFDFTNYTFKDIYPEQ